MDKQDKNHDEEDEKDDDDIHHDEDKQYFLNVKKIQRSQNVDQYESAESSQNVDQDESAESSQKFDEGESAETFGEDVPNDVIGPSARNINSRHRPYVHKKSDSYSITHPLKENEIKFGNKLSDGLRKAALKFLKDSIERYRKDRKRLALMILGEHDLSEMIQSLPSQESQHNVQYNIVPTTPYSNTHFHSKLKTMFDNFTSYGTKTHNFVDNKFNLKLK